jgi:proteasome lid subunit RPN8/RPN11
MSSLEIDPTALEGLVRHAERSLPLECCGVLVGSRLEGSTRVRRALASKNTAVRPESRFEIPAATLLGAQRSAREEALEVVGYYHSHPAGPAVPSATDRADAWPGVSYLIVSASGASAGEVRSWRLKADGAFAEEEFRVLGVVYGDSGARS